MDFNALLSDPNFLQYLGTAGSKFSSGQSFGEAFNPAGLISQIQSQKATKALIDQMLGPNAEASQDMTPKVISSEDLVSETPPIRGSGSVGPTPTPVGTPGPDEITVKTTADGTTTTVKEPSEQNLNTFGTSVPPESITKEKPKSPFLEALLGP